MSISNEKSYLFINTYHDYINEEDWDKKQTKEEIPYEEWNYQWSEIIEASKSSKSNVDKLHNIIKMTYNKKTKE